MRAAPLAVLAVLATTAHAEPRSFDDVFAQLRATGTLDNPCFAVSVEKRVTVCATRRYIRNLRQTVYSVELFAAAGIPFEQVPFAGPDDPQYQRDAKPHGMLRYVRDRLDREHFVPVEPSFRDLRDRGFARVAGHTISRIGDRVMCDGAELRLVGLGFVDRTTLAIAEPLPGVMLVQARVSGAKPNEVIIDSVDLANGCSDRVGDHD